MSFIVFIHHILIEQLLCARHWSPVIEANRNPALVTGKN